MRIASMLVFAGLMASAGLALADEQQGGFTPTLGMVTMMTLGQSGILGSMFSNEIYGSVQSKTGLSRATIGYIEDSLVGQGVPEQYWPKFKDRGTTFVVPMSFIKELPSGSGANFLRLNLEPTWADGRDHLPVQSKGGSRRAELQFLHAPIPTRILGVGLLYERSYYDIGFNQDPLNTVGRSERDAWGLQLQYAEAYSPSWALASRIEYQKGKSDYTVSNSFFRQHNRFDEDRLYMQAELIGTFTAQEIGFLPDSWLFRPILGANFQQSMLGDASVSVVNKKHENYGAVWALARFEKRQGPGANWQFMPTFSVGLEREYVNDLNVRLKDANYGLATVGFGVARGPFRLDMEYKLRRGLDDKRSENVISATMSLLF